MENANLVTNDESHNSEQSQLLLRKSSVGHCQSPGLLPIRMPMKRKIAFACFVGILLALLGTLVYWFAFATPPKYRIKASGGSVLSLAFSPNGMLLAIGCSDGFVRVFDIEHGCYLASYSHSGQVMDVWFCPDGRNVSSAAQIDSDGGIIVETSKWDAYSGAEMSLHQNRKPPLLHSEVISPDSRLAARIRKRRQISVYNCNSKEDVITLDGHSDAVNCVRFSSDSKLLLTGGGDTVVACPSPFPWQTSDVRLWEIKTGRLIAIFRGHRGPIGSVAFAPDSTLMASGGYDGVVQIWDLSRYTFQDPR